MFRSFGPVEIILVLLIILVVFGVGRLPQVGGAIGRGIHEFRKATRDDDSSEEKGTEQKSKSESNEKADKD